MPTYLIDWTPETPHEKRRAVEVVADSYRGKGGEFLFYRSGEVVERLPMEGTSWGVRSVKEKRV
jgi:hypothetical protein